MSLDVALAQAQLEGAGIDLASFIRDVPDYPSAGILFKDITGLLVDPAAFAAAIEALVAFVPADADLISGMEARGFIVGAALAGRLGKGFVPIRKAGKLPPPTRRLTYSLEYGEASVEIREGTVEAGARVMLIDDVLATGGTAAAGAELLEQLGAVVVGLGFVLELEGLGGRERLSGRTVCSVLAAAS
ncbi:adenine phosphoribosyltransferase [Sanguibacter gelidistatuariae]|uniref:Adenine phosphoribosyltransferase n=1 Tax=Sanguibacter gelidistatuariae TaxID=1814289 RepID=A0A1G6JV86_9MICO|nr:adenine phosphoribosyltransferase [Sanguibacter gelidistatuariae]SDC22578.1 adenine phosphoribosyltransferase [Sanguibacter gelidistatuariae]